MIRFIGKSESKISLIWVGIKEIKKVKIIAASISRGKIRKNLLNPNIIRTEINIPIHEFLEFVSNMETTNNKHIIVVITFLDILLLEVKK